MKKIKKGKKGWFRESQRHALASKGIKTGRKLAFKSAVSKLKKKKQIKKVKGRYIFISKKKPTRFAYRKIKGGRQRLGFRDSEVVEIKQEMKNPKKSELTIKEQNKLLKEKQEEHDKLIFLAKKKYLDKGKKIPKSLFKKEKKWAKEYVTLRKELKAD